MVVIFTKRECMQKIIETDRMILSTWDESHLEGMNDLNSDPEVMEFFPSFKTEEQNREHIVKLNKSYTERGYTFFAAQEKCSGEFIGMLGYWPLEIETKYTPGTEIGWRFRKKFWGSGLATEGAKACLEHAKANGLTQIVAIAVPENIASLKVMEKIGMKYVQDADFMHPKIPMACRYRKHVLYVIDL